uniref:Variant surface glycoprotein 1125.3092 n=2 Tax=Trypanosoma brucei TaxID=5691 RepID=A0A1J0R9I5_9TRYP|nr:variant surface glycoprotein 1125.3092 [Trypanosoma brucei]
MKEKVKASGTMALTEQGLIIARAAISETASQMQELRKRYRAETQPTKTLTAQDVTAAVNTAVYGTTNKPSPNPGRDAVFGGASSGNREALCTAEAGSAKAATALATLACLCNKGTSAVAPPVCSKGADGASAWEGSTGENTNPSDTELKTIAESCSVVKGSKITHHEISNRIKAVTKLIHVEATNGYLGAFADTECNGSSGSGVCVKFPNFKTNAEQALQKVKWIYDLTDMAATLKDMENKKAAAEQILTQIKAAAEKSEASIKHAAASAHAISINQTKGPTPANTVQEQNKCKTKNTTAEECPSEHCVYDKEKGCKPKPGTETAAAGTGQGKDGDNKTTATECTATSETNCDKNKCTWDKEKNQCKVKEGAAVISAVIKAPLLLAVLLF